MSLVWFAPTDVGGCSERCFVPARHFLELECSQVRCVYCNIYFLHIVTANERCMCHNHLYSSNVYSFLDLPLLCNPVYLSLLHQGNTCKGFTRNRSRTWWVFKRTSSHLIYSCLISISSHLIYSRLLSSYLISFTLISSHLLLSHLISSHLISSHLIYSHLHLPSSHLI